MKKSIVLLFTLFLCCNLYGCKNKDTTILNINSITDISKIEIQNGPMKKNITEAKDIKKITEKLNNIEYNKKLESEDINGWNYVIRIYNSTNKITNSITFAGNRINYRKSWYEVDSEFLNEIKKVYNEMDYNEKKYSDN
ncbi:hypothetical protein [Abyssisolibacter fermentans]|uniref:hypothetical protein n=1 Tax=Abyssisolibacter fermentans TaxID=1766203 RepID=UPI0008371DA9|nr:hypothetical protein [Abyssisolibacter fermentans]